uniref:Uncharacterized protein n=1 Tax=Fagus sylvatica TaxID=28930 RepID=A0A2N9I2F4_FAGSY
MNSLLSAVVPMTVEISKTFRSLFWGGNRSHYIAVSRRVPSLSAYDNTYPIIRFEELEFRVLDINKSHHIMTIARLDLLNIGTCPQKFLNTTLNFTNFDYVPTDQNLTLFYDCPPRVNIPVQIALTAA